VALHATTETAKRMPKTTSSKRVPPMSIGSPTTIGVSGARKSCTCESGGLESNSCR
jgi:hypothetical protein